MPRRLKLTLVVAAAAAVTIAVVALVSHPGDDAELGSSQVRPTTTDPRASATLADSPASLASGGGPAAAPAGGSAGAIPASGSASTAAGAAAGVAAGGAAGGAAGVAAALVTSVTQPVATAKTPAAGPQSSAKNAGTGRIQYGRTYHGAGTFYAATGAGNCSYDASSDLMVGAMNQQDYDNSQSCGAFLAVTGPRGNTVTIKVVDRCPECPPGAIDLSREAFTKLAPAQTGRIQISWRLLSPSLSTPVSYRYKSGSSQYWCGIQVLGHRNPVRTLELRSGSSWVAVPRQDYNYFVSASGTGCGNAIRVTDIYGNRLTSAGITVQPDVVQRGHGQFPQR